MNFTITAIHTNTNKFFKTINKITKLIFRIGKHLYKKIKLCLVYKEFYFLLEVKNILNDFNPFWFVQCFQNIQIYYDK